MILEPWKLTPFQTDYSDKVFNEGPERFKSTGGDEKSSAEDNLHHKEVIKKQMIQHPR